MTDIATLDPTQMRLLEAAGKVFAEKGFAAATVRDICQLAEANVAAVNYHFGDKERLYIEAVKHAHRCKLSSMPTGWPEGMAPEQKLRQFVAGMLQLIVFEDVPAWHAQLILREMVEPTRACEEMVRENVRPMADRLLAIIDELVPSSMSRAQRYLIGYSIVGQILFYRTHKPMTALLLGEEEYRQLNVERLTNHVTGMVLAALGKQPPITAPQEVQR